MKAVMLAAGLGERIRPISKGKPKCMVEVGGISLIHHQINACLRAGIREFVIVVGYERDMVMAHCLELLSPEDVRFVTNSIYKQTNTLYSLWLVLGKYRNNPPDHPAADDILYFNCDVLFHPDLLHKLTGNDRGSRLLIEEKVCGDEEVKAVVDSQNFIQEIGKVINPTRCMGEFIGVARFVREDIPPFAKRLQEGVEQGQSRNYFEWAVNLLAGETNLLAVSTDGLPCIEIDFPEDWEKAQTVIYPKIVATTRQD